MQQGNYKEEEKTEEEEAASCHVPLLHNRKKLHLAMNDGGLLFYDIDIYIIIYIYSCTVHHTTTSTDIYWILDIFQKNYIGAFIEIQNPNYLLFNKKGGDENGIPIQSRGNKYIR